jgi:hypothetical protein
LKLELKLSTYKIDCWMFFFLIFFLNLFSSSMYLFVISLSHTFSHLLKKPFSNSFFIKFIKFCRFAYVRADAGYATSSSVVGVTLSSIKFSEYATGVVTDVTSSYSAQQCSTKAYQSVTPYLKSKSDCLFSKSFPPLSLRNNTVICQGFVKSVDYTITHLATSSGIIPSVSAAVIITDVPIYTVNTANSAGLSSQSSTVSVMQSFSVTFTSGDASRTNNVNGNVVKRYTSLFINWNSSFKLFIYLLLLFEILFL